MIRFARPEIAVLRDRSFDQLTMVLLKVSAFNKACNNVIITKKRV